MPETAESIPLTESPPPATRRGCLRLALFIAAGICLLALFLVVIHAVPTHVNEEDEEAIQTLFQGNWPTAKPESFAEQVVLIRRLQAGIAAAAPISLPIPYGQAREPADLLREGQGICYDRSRTIEKALTMAGFQVRHAALYSLAPDLGVAARLRALAFRKDLQSHSVSECMTARGWLVVDSNHPWLSLDSEGGPIALQTIRNSFSSDPIDWQEAPPEVLYCQPFTVVYGLYSRHGQFYPPFSPVPDINWREMARNF